VERVALLIKEEMIRAVQELYPMLRPRADINIDRPECWNKDGKADSIKQWLAAPFQTVNQMLGCKGMTLEKPANAPTSTPKECVYTREVNGINL
jgi:hypothetical protein